jgi:6,7-dimethyl-8-ribityllumazine synthase
VWLSAFIFERFAMTVHEKKVRSYQFANRPHVMVVEARYYDDIADLLAKGALARLEAAGATIERYTVPGAFEIPAAISFAMKSLDFDPTRKRFDGYVTLGCILKGGTQHDEIVARESARALQDLAVRHALAIGLGILTCNSREQALDRADPARLDRGGEAAEACLAMIEMKHNFHLNPKRRWVARPSS